MNVSAPFIRRPIATFLIAFGILLVGGVSYGFLPVANLPAVELPILTVSARLPGASPETVAATVAAPLERRLGAIPGVTALTSSSTQGSTRIMVQFALSRSIDGAAQDVQAAINATRADLPANLPSPPHLRKFDPSSFPILIIALTSETLSSTQLFDIADTVMAQRMSQVKGVSDVAIAGAAQPAIRVDMQPHKLKSMGLGLEAVRKAIVNANVTRPLGSFDDQGQHASIGINDSLRTPADYKQITIRQADGTIVRLDDVADVYSGKRNRLLGGSFDGDPRAVILIARPTSGANVVSTVDRLKVLLPELQRWIPAGVNVSIFLDRTKMIRSSINHLEVTMLFSIVLVMLVVLVFLRRGVPTLTAGVTVPLALAGTATLMWLSGFSLDNLSLMALTISVGFVVDDAIVMIENIYRNLEAGMRPLRATYAGAKQIGFTVISITVSLIAAFSPLVLMPGIPGRLMREFSLTLIYAFTISALVSLTITPMMCSLFIRRAPQPGETRLDRWLGPALTRMDALYAATLKRVIHQRALMLGVTGLALVAMVSLGARLPKSVIPQGDADLLIGVIQGAPDASFEQMQTLEQQTVKIVRADPAVEHLGASVGSAGRSSGNQGRMFIGLKPASQRKATAQQVIDRLRPKLAKVVGARVFIRAVKALPTGVHQSEKGAHQFTLWSPNLGLLDKWIPKMLAQLKQLPELEDVATNRNPGGPQLDIKINRTKAARLGVQVADIDAALNDAFSQRQISTIYTQTNQYKVILGVLPQLQRELADVNKIHVTAADGEQVPLSVLTTTSLGTTPLSVHHDGQFPSVSFSYNLAADVPIGTAQRAIANSLVDLHAPADLHVDQTGTRPASGTNQLLLILAALVSVYLVLGILYESLIHPLTIISTLPSAGFGAMLALYVTGTELSLMPVIGIVLLIGIIMKNGIMLVDFALESERKYGLAPELAIFQAAKERFRPITMTTLAAAFGVLPLIVAGGPGVELRRPLGITIVGGLIISQFLTIYTTPVIYLVFDRMRWRRRKRQPDHSSPASPRPG